VRKISTVAIVLNSDWNIINFRSDLIRALLIAKYRVVAISPRGQNVDKILELGSDFIPLYHLSRKGTNPLKDLQLLVELSRIYKRENIDIALHYTIKPVIYGSFAARIAGIHCINTITGLGYAFLSNGIVNKTVQQLYRWSLRNANHTFLQNQDDYEFFLRQKLSPANRTSIIPGSGINLDYFSPFKVKAKPVSFLFIGRLLYDKGLQEFVEAARLVKKKFPIASFHLLGALDEDNPSAISREILKLWVEEGVIEYHGVTSDTRPYIAQSTALVLPSYREGLPRVMLEGMAMAKPLIASDVPGCRDTVVNGQNGYLVKVKSPESLAEAIIKIINHSKEELIEMGKAGRTLAKKKFSKEIVISKYIAILTDFER
jgi:glycosyltransferase involved in cell wall biosynthesis